MKLILPTPKYIVSFLEMAEDLHQAGHWYDGVPEQLEKNFSIYLKKLEDAKIGANLAPGEVSNTEFWMLENENIVGRLRLNHTLSDPMKIRGGHIGYGVHSHFRGRGFATQALGLALDIAKHMGLHEVLITCDDSNANSIRVIEKNSGELKDKIVAPGRNIATRRYVVQLSTRPRSL